MQAICRLLLRMLVFPIAMLGMLTGIALAALVLQTALLLLVVFLAGMALWTMLTWVLAGMSDKSVKASLMEVFR